MGELGGGGEVMGKGSVSQPSSCNCANNRSGNGERKNRRWWARGVWVGRGVWRWAGVMGKVLHKLYLTEAVPLVKFTYLVFMVPDESYCTE